MSMKRTVVLTAVSSSNHVRNKTAQSSGFDSKNMRRNQTNYDGGLNVNMSDNVNVVLAGAMLSVLTALICLLCYCCNKSINKRSMAIYRQRWMESLNDPNMGIYSIEQFYDSTTSHATPNTAYRQGEPPSYEAVMKLEKYAGDEKHLIYDRFGRTNTCPNCGSVQLKNSQYSKSIPSTEPMLIDIGNKQIIEQNETTNDICMGCDNKSSDMTYVEDNNGNSSSNCYQKLRADSTANSKSDNDMIMTLDANTVRPIEASTSSDSFNVEFCENCAVLSNQARKELADDDDFDHLNGNGIVRMDMSKIIDSTGLPTYDAALKLESCGYV